MEIILIEDVEGLGDKGAVVQVKAGFARNYLLPRRMAITATGNATNLYRELQRQRTVQEDRRLIEAREVAAKLQGVEVNIPAAANAEDTLFGSVTESEIAAALTQAGHRVEARQVQLPEHIKQLGKYDVELRIRGEVTATVKVWVVRP